MHTNKQQYVIINDSRHDKDTVSIYRQFHQSAEADGDQCVVTHYIGWN